MDVLTWPQEPGSDELAELYATADIDADADADADTLLSPSTAPTTFSDDQDAFNETQAESKRANHAQGNPVQHRSWKTSDIFHSEANMPNSSPVQMPNMTSSPPPSPSPRKKRKHADLDLGTNTLLRPAKALKAQQVYYGINIHQLLDDAKAEDSIPKAAYELPTLPVEPASKKSSLLWTEKYRAKKFTDLIGDERTHRAVMHWLKRWDQIVFPGSYRKPKAKGDNAFEEKPHKKILMLTGPPGLGKTTLAHVCAKQAGYEVQEINASDERSSNVVKGRIRDMVGTENVKSVDAKSIDGKKRRAVKPACVIVDEVDGVVSGSGGSGEGGFVKALIDLVMLDQKNSAGLADLQQAPARKKKGDRFRLLRPLILVCNDVYHPSLRPLRQSSVAEVIHMRKPPVESLVNRLTNIFQKEGVPCEGDGVRRLCEATWGVSNRKEDRNGKGAGEGDMRGILVVGEWVAGKLRNEKDARLTRKWVEKNVLSDLQHGGGAARGLGRGGPKDIVERVFQEGAGFPKSTAMATPQQHSGAIDSVKGVAEGFRRTATERLRQLVDTHGDTDRIISDCFSAYPEHPFQDDTLLSKPDSAYEWLHFHDRLSSAVFSSNEWELAPYLSAPVLAFHHLFASPTRAQYQQANQTNADPDAADPSTAPHPFTGPTASWAAHEAEKQNTAHLQTLQSSLSLPLTRLFPSASDIATDLQPYLYRMLSPTINPTIISGNKDTKPTASVRKASEQTLLKRAVNAMGATGVRFDRVRVSSSSSSSTTTDGSDAGPSHNHSAQWVFRMEPPLDTLCTFETGGKNFGTSAETRTRFAVRQALDQEWRKEEQRIAEEARLARFGFSAALPGKSGDGGDEGLTVAAVSAGAKKIARDFFGRPIVLPADGSEAQKSKGSRAKERAGPTVWVTYHEGYSNAVRKPLTLAELMGDL